ncbi:MAG TPA: CoA transferase [Acidimicrobiia bacterium]|nr:CoA transferase [Acidimicrobiia bacterium]
MAGPQKLLEDVRIVECSMLGPAGISTCLADLGADVIKIEPPSGDYVREMTWPIVEGVSLMHLHLNRGKRSLTLDLKTEGGVETFLALVERADAVVEAMRPGGLARRGLGFERLREINPRIVMCTISGYGMTGPYRDLPSHGIAYDSWAGVFKPAVTEDGFPYIPEHVSIGINAGPMYGAIAILAGIVKARATGEGAFLEIAQSDAAAGFDWYRIETVRAYERPQSEVTGNKSDNYERRAAGTAGMAEGVRYQIYESSDGYVMLMCSEQAFWKNFCESVGRLDLFEKWPGSKYADHARGNTELRTELRDIFKTRTSKEWLDLSGEANFPLAPVNDSGTVAQDPQFVERLGWIPKERLGADQLPIPVRLVDGELAWPGKAPELGEHTDAVLAEVLGYDDERIAELRQQGALG